MTISLWGVVGVSGFVLAVLNTVVMLNIVLGSKKRR